MSIYAQILTYTKSDNIHPLRWNLFVIQVLVCVSVIECAHTCMCAYADPIVRVVVHGAWTKQFKAQCFVAEDTPCA